MTNLGDTDPGARSSRKHLTRLFAERSGATEARLTSIIFDDIAPRLRLLHHDLPDRGAEGAFTGKEIADFGGILIANDGVAADLFLEGMRARHPVEEALVLGLFAEAARYLGGLWADDRCSFVDVTIGVARLQKLLCVFSRQSDPAISNGRQRAALCALNGERHVFGVDMVACFMRHARWEVDLLKGAETDDIADLISGEWFAVLGFTASSELGLDGLARAIAACRAASANPRIGILVGGPLFLLDPGLVAQVGADATAGDAASTTLLAKKLLQRQETKIVAKRRFRARLAPHELLIKTA